MIVAAVTLTAPAAATVVPGDLFTFSMAGFNSASGIGFILGSGTLATFGTTQTFDNAGYNDQSYTISSSEVVGATTTTAFFKISTPTNFLTSTMVNGQVMTALQFDIGTANSGVGVATGADPVDFLFPIDSYAAAGNLVYGTGNAVFALTPTVNLMTGGLSFTAAEGVNTGTTPISTIAIHEFNISITYANAVAAVPEPATWAMMIAGFGLVGATLRRRSAKVSFAA